MTCEHCDSAPATHEHYGEHYCDDCFDAASEAAWERFCEDFYGGSGAVTVLEQYDAAQRQRRELRRLD